MKLRHWRWGGTVLAALLALSTCGIEINLENNSAELLISPRNLYGRMQYVKFKPLNAHACCEQIPAGYVNDGAAIWALDGLNHWWHNNYRTGDNNIGYDNNTGTNGHVNDNGNYLRRGNADAVDGYTWTKNTSLAVPNGTGGYRRVGDVVPSNGAQWITLDMGRVVELQPGEYLRLGYERRSDGNETGRLCRATNRDDNVYRYSYDIYVSQKDFGWIVDTPDVVQIANRAYKATAAGLVWLNYYTPSQPLKFRYVQLRWRFTSSVSGTDYKAATAQNIMLKISRADLDFDYLYAVYNHGQNVLKNIPVSSRDYTDLKKALNDTTVRQFFSTPASGVMATPQTRLEYQDRMDDAASGLLNLIYRIAPPNELPEVVL